MGAGVSTSLDTNGSTYSHQYLKAAHGALQSLWAVALARALPHNQVQ